MTPVRFHALLKACHDRCTVGHFHFSKNALASCTVSKHAHSSTDSSCIVRTTVNTGQTHQIITALRVCILLFVCNVQEISGSEALLNTNRIKYNFVCVRLICASFKNYYLQYLPSRLCKSNLLQYPRHLFHSGVTARCSRMPNFSCIPIPIETTC